MNKDTGGCSVAIGSITQAMKAQKVLGEAAIPTTVIKYEDNSRNGKGCVYGLSYSCAQAENLRTVLEKAKIRVKQWKGG